MCVCAWWSGAVIWREIEAAVLFPTYSRSLFFEYVSFLAIKFKSCSVRTFVCFRLNLNLSRAMLRMSQHKNYVLFPPFNDSTCPQYLAGRPRPQNLPPHLSANKTTSKMVDEYLVPTTTILHHAPIITLSPLTLTCRCCTIDIESIGDAPSLPSSSSFSSSPLEPLFQWSMPSATGTSTYNIRRPSAG